MLSTSGKSLHYTLSVADIENPLMAHIHIGAQGRKARSPCGFIRRSRPLW